MKLADLGLSSLSRTGERDAAAGTLLYRSPEQANHGALTIASDVWSWAVTMIAMLSYFVAIIAVIDDPDGLVANIATFLPPSAPFVVPLRAAFDAIPAWQIGVSAILTLIGIYILFTIGARVYAGAVLQFGGRIKLRDAWRSGE